MRIENYISGSVVSAVMLCSGIPVLAQTTPAATAKFSDPSTGVRFQYPASWKSAKGNQFYLAPVLVSDKDDRRGGVVWKADQTAKTNLAGAQFIYALRRDVSAEECLHPKEDGSTEPPRVDTVSVSGVPYAHGSAEDGGMCHQEKENIYTTYRSHACYLFDLSVHTVCSGAVDGMRDATAAELADINASLLGILKTVRIREATDGASHSQNTIH